MSGQKPDPVQQGVKELTSATLSSLKAIGVPDTDAFASFAGLVEAIVAAAASSGGTLGVVVAAVGFVTTMLQLLNQGSSQTQQASQAMVQFLQQLGLDEAFNFFSGRMTNIQTQLEPVNTARDDLQTLARTVRTAPGLQDEEVRNRLDNIDNAMNGLMPPDVAGRGCSTQGQGGPWEVNSSYVVYWDDSDSPDNQWPPAPVAGPLGLPIPGTHYGYEKQAPTAGSGNAVFYYNAILPAYLYAISVFVATGSLIDPKFSQNRSDTLKNAACLLQSVHDYIMKNGVVQLSPSPGIAAPETPHFF
jgi:hypothetical protein